MSEFRVFMGVVIVILTALSGTAAEASGLATGASIEIPWIRILLGVLVCGAIAFSAIHVLRHRMSGRAGLPRLLKAWTKIGEPGAGPRLRVIETRRLNLQADVCLFECDDREYLVAISQGRVVQLDANAAVKLESDNPRKAPE